MAADRPVLFILSLVTMLFLSKIGIPCRGLCLRSVSAFDDFRGSSIVSDLLKKFLARSLSRVSARSRASGLNSVTACTWSFTSRMRAI